MKDVRYNKGETLGIVPQSICTLKGCDTPVGLSSYAPSGRIIHLTPTPRVAPWAFELSPFRAKTPPDKQFFGKNNKLFF